MERGRKTEQKSEWAGQLHDDSLTCRCTASGLLSVVHLPQIALLFVIHFCLRIRGVYCRVPRAKCEDLLSKPYLLPLHSHRTIYLLDPSQSARVRRRRRRGRRRQRERDVCEVFISTGISLPPLIPSLGSPLLFMFCTQ